MYLQIGLNSGSAEKSCRVMQKEIKENFKKLTKRRECYSLFIGNRNILETVISSHPFKLLTRVKRNDRKTLAHSMW